MRLDNFVEGGESAPPTAQETIDRIRARRAPHDLFEIDKMLLHSLPFAEGWHYFFQRVRTELSLAPEVREIAICRVAVINQAWYEWKHHAPILHAAGVSEGALLSILNGSYEGLDEKLKLVVRYTDAMTKEVVVDDPLFTEIKEVFTNKEIVELTGVIAAYNCVSRFLVALNIGSKNNTPPTEERLYAEAE